MDEPIYIFEQSSLFSTLDKMNQNTISRWVWEGLQPPAGAPTWSGQTSRCCSWRPQCAGHSRFHNRSRFSCGKSRASHFQGLSWLTFSFHDAHHGTFIPLYLGFLHKKDSELYLFLSQRNRKVASVPPHIPFDINTKRRITKLIQVTTEKSKTGHFKTRNFWNQNSITVRIW